MLEFMACGRPVILGVDGQARQVIETAQAGVFVEPEDPQLWHRPSRSSTSMPRIAKPLATTDGNTSSKIFPERRLRKPTWGCLKS